MATIKSYSDLKQSKKLAEFLPLKSADMSYKKEFITTSLFGEPIYDYKVKPDYCKWSNLRESIPCWSLAALLGILPKVINNETLFIETSPALWHIGYRNVYTARTDNLIDACYEMIIKLHELKMF